MRLPCAYPIDVEMLYLARTAPGPSRTSGLTADGRPGEDREQRLTFNVERKERHRIGLLMAPVKLRGGQVAARRPRPRTPSG